MVQKSMDYFDETTGLFLADPLKDPFAETLPAFEEVSQSAETLILSASGWRKVFAADCDEESKTKEVQAADKIIVGTAALSFVEFLKTQQGPPLLVWTGCDSRPTGAALQDIMIRVMLSLGVKVKASFITAAPELMAAVKRDTEAHGFAYISASHNPIGHNGIKFGGANGAVYGGRFSTELIERFRTKLEDPETINRIVKLCRNTPSDVYTHTLESIHATKKHAEQSYAAFTKEVVSGSSKPLQQQAFFDSLSESLKSTPTGILGELNGSARSTSIDHRFLQDSGFLVEMHNDKPGQIVHRIVPEGSSLDTCRRLLSKAHKVNPAFSLGYVPDNDGDRGNVVFYPSQSTSQEEAEVNYEPQIIEAQELFALVVLAELAYLDHLQSRENPSATLKPKAVVVNGPTSMRIERIAKAFHAEVWRAEVGEANVVNLAAELREKGYLVRILGEGSNGGNITHPSTVRDPLNTIFSLSKLIAFRDEDNGFNPYVRWCNSAESQSNYTRDFTLAHVLNSLPPFVTTSAYEPEAKMRISTRDHATLKRRWEEVFLEEWEYYKELLHSKYGIVSWREVNYEGTQARTGFGADYRSGSEKGGLKIIFSNEAGEDTDFIWMRGSGTEPVFRVLVDSNGRDIQRHDWLLNWQRSMIESADSVQ